MSEPPGDPNRSALDRALDLFVYAPAGLVLSAVDEFPELAAKGRSRLGQQLRTAQVVGEFAVKHGHKSLRRRLRGPGPAAAPTAAPAPVRAPAPPHAPVQGPAAAPPAGGQAPGAAAAPARVSKPATRTPAANRYEDPAVDRALPGYDTLSASQVVRRLDGLGPEELDAVYRHEAATRGRRTILHRVQQLQGTEGTPGAVTGTTV